MTKKIVVDQELCIGCGVCENLCPDVFEMQNGKAKVISSDDCDHKEAITNCPVGAIKAE